MQGPKPGRMSDPSDERVILASEEDVVWDYGHPSQGDTALIRWRTLVWGAARRRAGSAWASARSHRARSLLRITIALRRSTT